MASGKRFHSDSRTRENFTESGLTSLTGQDTDEWRRYVVKELLDNALEAADEAEQQTGGAPEIDIELTYDDWVADALDDVDGGSETAITVADNGPGIPRDRLEKITEDVDEFGGTKRHYQLPTRGNQGNALMTILGIQHLAEPDVPLEIHTRGTEYAIHVRDSALETPHAELVAVGESDVDGTAITVRFGASWLPDWSRNLIDTLDVIREFVAVNPQASFTVRQVVDGDVAAMFTFGATPNPTVESLSLPAAATTGKATWFNIDEFTDRVKADARAAPDLTIGNFIQEFKGLSSPAKRDAVLDNARERQRQDRERGEDDGALLLTAALPIAALFDDGVHSQTITNLWAAMRDETRTFSESSIESSIGSIGRDLVRRTVDYADQDGDVTDVIEQLQTAGIKVGGEPVKSPQDLAVYYRDGAVIERGLNKTIPFTFELVAVPTRIVGPESYNRTTVAFGLNQSVTYEPPSFSRPVEIQYSNTTDPQRSVSSAFNRLDHDFTIVANLTCSNLDYQDKGKQTIDTKPFHGAFADVIGKAVRKIERDIRPRLNDLVDEPEPEPDPTVPNKAAKGFIKDFTYENIEDAYAEASDSGEYTVTQRQLFYVIRPWFYTEATKRGYEHAHNASYPDPEPLEFRYDTFTTNLKNYEENELGERLCYRDDRGSFVEPHSNADIDLGTAAVKRYEPKPDEYGNLLFVEKEGFYELLHKDLELSKRYDVGIINGKGFSTNAIRKLVEKIQAATDATMYTLTDLDIGGLGIAANAAEADALSEINTLDVERLGVTLDDVRTYDLPVESVAYESSELSRLTAFAEAGGDADRFGRDPTIDSETAAFLRENGGQRVEINAFRPAELEAYLIDKFEEHGIDKIHPAEDDVEVPELDDGPEDVLERARNAVIADAVLDQVEYDDLETRIAEATDLPDPDDVSLDAVDAVTREQIHAAIIEQLAEHPPKPWTDINDELVDERKAEAIEQLDDYETEVRKAIEDLLADAEINVSINFAPPA